MSTATAQALPALAPAPASASAQGVTHVLHWVPPYLTGTPAGQWELQGLDGYNAGSAPDGPELAAPRESLRRDLAQWAGSQLGYPVLLRPGYATITCLRALRLWRREPVYYVQADPFAAVRRSDERDTFRISAYGDSIAAIEAAATAAARQLYGPDSELCTDWIDTIHASWADEERGRYHASVTVRCLNYHAIAAGR